MGCASSKQRRRCRHCRAPYSPIRRSYSMNDSRLPHRDRVALKPTTLGSLLLEDPHNIDNAISFDKDSIISKTWSDTIKKKIPKTPIRTPPGEPETINTWELMEGLEDDVSPFTSPGHNNHVRSFSFDTDRDPPFEKIRAVDPFTGKDEPSDDESDRLDGKSRVVVYYTSLRGVRKTYEDCCRVRAVLKAAGVRVDERDVSMHSGFREELKELLADRLSPGSGYGLPGVFVGRDYIGGAEELRRIHEEGRLEKLLENCERAGSGGDGNNDNECEGCGDVRFVLCETCSGSCKIFYGRDFEVEEEEEEEEREAEDEECKYGFQRCPDCNENGLVRCTICCE